MRMFVGIALGEEARAALERLTLRLRTPEDGLRWSPPEQWHVTLAFLGHAEPRPLGDLQRRLKRLRLPSADLALEGLGSFENAGVLYAAVQTVGQLGTALLGLQAAVAEAARSAGFALEDRPYRPHVTLARSRNPAGRRALRSLTEALARQPFETRWRTDEFLLYESRPSTSGSRYIVRQRYPLSAAGPDSD
jgi:2'-5' RNA ligase